MNNHRYFAVSVRRRESTFLAILRDWVPSRIAADCRTPESKRRARRIKQAGITASNKGECVMSGIPLIVARWPVSSVVVTGHY
jgi:hypothetical protein